MERTKKKIDMDYEKKYKEALERFKTFREKYCAYGELHFGDVIFDKTGEAQKDLDAIFPELRESEDERHRKWILEYLYDGLRKADEQFKGQFNAAIAYLEKQKEPIDPFDTKLFQDGVKEGKRLEREDIMKERQPAEWSEKDENNLELVIDCIYKFYPDPVMKYKLKEWLKSLRPVKQEWSEEDEKNRRNLMSLLANMRGDRITEETYQKYYPWLKSLRSRPKPSDNWKPSEEQPQVADASKMEQPEIDFEQVLYNHFGQVKDFTLGMRIAAYFYELGLNARKEK